MSKLNQNEKQELRDMRECQSRVEIFHYPEYRVTIAARKTGSNMAEFSAAICSASEPKYRKKTGEYFARQRMDAGAVVPVEIAGRDIGVAALDFARMLTY